MHCNVYVLLHPINRIYNKKAFIIYLHNAVYIQYVYIYIVFSVVSVTMLKIVSWTISIVNLIGWRLYNVTIYVNQWGGEHVAVAPYRSLV